MAPAESFRSGSVENPGAWLTTVVARVCLDMLRSRKSRREEDFTAHCAEPPAPASDPLHKRALADSVGPALLVVLDALVPAERVAFVLHDLFDMPFDQIGEIVLSSRPAGS